MGCVWYNTVVSMKHTFFQLLRFTVIGSTNTGIDIGVYALLTRTIDWFGAHYLTAAVVSFFVAGINGFFWNKHWTFRHKVKYAHRQMVKYLTVACIALTINQLLLWGLVNGGVHDILGKFIATVLAGVLNFLMQKFWTFPLVEAVVDAIENEYNEHTHHKNA